MRREGGDGTVFNVLGRLLLSLVLFRAEDLCVIWEDHIGFRRKTSWVLVVGLPLLLGPILSLFLELVFSLIHKLGGNISTDIRNYALLILVLEGNDLFSMNFISCQSD